MTGRRTYRINVVSEMTGVPAATLRAWERRYGFPKPERTDSRYRVYSEEDVAMVRRMKELLQSGMAPSDSAMLLMNEPATPAPSNTGEEDPFAACVTRMLDAARRMAADALENEVRYALTLGDAVAIVERVFVPTMYTIGQEWEEGKLTVAHEHMASEVITLATRQLLRLMPMGQARMSGVLGCFAEEQHVMPLYAVAFRFVEQAVRPEILGLRTPPEAIASAVRERAPDIVGLSVTVRPDPAQASEWVEQYVRAVGDRPLLVGGAGIDSVADAFERGGARVVTGGGEAVQQALRDTLADLGRRRR